MLGHDMIEQPDFSRFRTDADMLCDKDSKDLMGRLTALGGGSVHPLEEDPQVQILRAVLMVKRDIGGCSANRFFTNLWRRITENDNA